MNGMDRATGKPLSDRAHLAQSIGDILTTPIGTRTMRRDYGSALFELIDQAGNALGRSRLYAAVAVALARWEPRLKLTKVGVTADAEGRAVIDLEGQYLEDAAPNSLVRLSIPLTPA
jgi:phage baseplate assembly protein W